MIRTTVELTDRSGDRLWTAPLVLTLLVGTLVCSIVGCNRREATWISGERRPNLILIVMDTVRRDRIEPCGYGKPTTPNLVRLASDATTFCRTVTPGTWTAPVHASLLTGRLPLEHGLDFLPVDVSETEPWNDIAKLSPEVPTLAEILSEHGYQTVLVSANPVVNEPLGLTRGFQYTNINDAHWTAGNPASTPMVGPILKQLDHGRPLFLVVNVWIAHNPHEPVPATLDWLEPSPGLDFFVPVDEIEATPFARFIRGRMSREEEQTLLSGLDRSYDWGLRLADRDVGRLLDRLDREGWITDDTTIVVTSDHGELLGEHHMLEHGGVLYRANNDVFTIVRGPGFARGRHDDALVQSQDVFPTLLRSAGIPSPELEYAIPLQTPDRHRTAVTLAMRDTTLSAYAGVSGEQPRFLVSTQEGEDRVLWTEGLPVRGERAPGLAPVEQESQPRPDLETRTLDFARAWQTSRRVVADIPEAMGKQLEALGYVR